MTSLIIGSGKRVKSMILPALIMNNEKIYISGRNAEKIKKILDDFFLKPEQFIDLKLIKKNIEMFDRIIFSIPTKNYTLADMADDAVNLLDHINVNCAHVMGFSMGGHIAQELAINYPDRVKSLGIHHSWSKNSPRLKKFQETRLHLAKNDQRIALTELSMLALHSSRYYDSNPKEMEAHRSFLLNQSHLDILILCQGEFVELVALHLVYQLSFQLFFQS